MEIPDYKNLPTPEKDLYSRDTKSKFLYVRHGKTEFNILQKELGTENITTEGKYTDGPLCDEGRAQARALQPLVNKMQIEHVFVSPLNRTLETCSLIFETHPDRKKFVCEISPIITEIVNTTYDIPKYIEDNKKKFNMNSNVQFDWSKFEELYKNEEERNFYYLNYVDTLEKDEIKEEFNNLVNANKVRKMSDAVSNLTVHAKNLGIPRLESYKHVFNRCVKFKEFLKEKYKDSLNDTNKKVVVVTHKAFIHYSSSKLAYKMEKIEKNPEDCCLVDNCEMVSIYI